MICEEIICRWSCLNKIQNNVTVIAYPDVAYKNEICVRDIAKMQCERNECNVSCQTNSEMDVDCTMKTLSFWFYVFLMSAGTIGFNVVNSISDAICFDVLGKINVSLLLCNFFMKKYYTRSFNFY